ASSVVRFCDFSSLSPDCSGFSSSLLELLFSSVDSEVFSLSAVCIFSSSCFYFSPFSPSIVSYTFSCYFFSFALFIFFFFFCVFIFFIVSIIFLGRLCSIFFVYILYLFFLLF